MFGISNYSAFVIAFILLLLLPGPGNLALITSTGKGGLKGGLAATLGIMAGDQVLMWLAVAGVAALLAANPVVFHSVQWVGAAYLTWLGYKMLVAKAGGKPLLNITAGHYFKQSFIITLFNPKAVMFYIAFFPQFIDPVHHQGWKTYMALSATICVLLFLYGVIAVLLTHYMAERLRANPQVTNVLQKVAGVFLIGFGVKLALGK
jgi:threonine/homoserine/homoserine lactone efflux protein